MLLGAREGIPGRAPRGHKHTCLSGTGGDSPPLAADLCNPLSLPVFPKGLEPPLTGGLSWC